MSEAVTIQARPPGNVPPPDPSHITFELVRREIAALRDIMDARFESIDKATELLSIQANKAPSETDLQVNALRNIHAEKFDGVNKAILSLETNINISLASLATGIQKQFDERDIRSQAAGLAAQVAVGAALQAQKEAAAAQNEANAAAITKSDAATAKQIDGIFNLLAANTKTVDEKNIAVVNLLGANTKTLDDKINDLTGRMNRNDGREKGSSGMIMLAIGVASVAIAAIAVVLTILSRVH